MGPRIKAPLAFGPSFFLVCLLHNHFFFSMAGFWCEKWRNLGFFGAGCVSTWHRCRKPSCVDPRGSKHKAWSLKGVKDYQKKGQQQKRKSRRTVLLFACQTSQVKQLLLWVWETLAVAKCVRKIVSTPESMWLQRWFFLLVELWSRINFHFNYYRLSSCCSAPLSIGEPLCGFQQETALLGKMSSAHTHCDWGTAADHLTLVSLFIFFFSLSLPPT